MFSSLAVVSMIDSMGPLDSVCVVRGCGFLGSAIVRGLLRTQSTLISVLDAVQPASPLPSVAYHQCDITEPTQTTTTLKLIRPTTIILSAVPQFAAPQDATLFQRVVVDGAAHVLAAAPDAGVRALVFVSSIGIVQCLTTVDKGTEDLPVFYDDTDRPALDPYYLSKALAERAVLAAHSDSGLHTCAIRPCTLYGPREPLFTVPILETARAGRNKAQFGDGLNMYDFVYVDNLVDAILLAVDALAREAASSGPVEPEKKVGGEAFNITDDAPVRFWWFTRALASAAGYRVEEKDVWVVPGWVGVLMAWVSEWVVWVLSAGRARPIITVAGAKFSMLHQTFSMEKAKERLGCRPQVGMQEGIRRVGQWYREEQGKKKA